MNKKVYPILLAFLCMGFFDAIGPFVGLSKNEFDISTTTAMIIPFLGFLMFGVLSIPMSIYQDKKGKKFILILGLFVAFAGLIIPIFSLKYFSLFLITVILLGAGAATLQVAGNPIMRDVSREGKYSRNLSLGQFIKAIGSLSGSVLPAIAVLYFGMDWKILFPVYSIIILLTILYISTTKLEEKVEKHETPASFSSCLTLLKNKFVLMMVLGIFVYIGAEVCMSSGIPIHVSSRYGIDIETFGIFGTGLFFLALTIGRFLGSVLLNWMKPKKFFAITTILSVIGILGIFINSTVITIISVFLSGLGFANIFPLIFSITVDRMPEKSNELSGLMITAIIGGAFLPPLMGVIVDNTSTVMGFIVPLAAVCYICWISLTTLKTK